MQNLQAAPQRSTFVTVIAIIFIALSAMSLTSSAMNHFVMGGIIHSTPPQANFRFDSKLQELVQTLLTYYTWFMLYALINHSLWLAASIGLLLRHNWARLTFIGMMLLNMATMLVMSIIMPFFVQRLMASDTQIPAEAKNMFLIATIVLAVGIAAFWSALSIWIVWKLTRPTIRAEFSP